jgi:hypothetical protein
LSLSLGCYDTLEVVVLAVLDCLSMEFWRVLDFYLFSEAILLIILMFLMMKLFEPFLLVAEV